MKTAARAMILASLVGVACSSETGDGESVTDQPGVGPVDSTGVTPGAPTDPAIPGTNPTNPGAVDPANPVATTPGVTDPGVTDPGVTDPGVTDPGVTDPGVTDPPIEMPNTGTCAMGVPVTSQIPRLTNVQYDRVVADVFDVTATGGAWSADFAPDSNGELPSNQWAMYKSTAETIAAAAMSTAQGEALTTAAADPAALDTAIRALGRKMFRRPMTEPEVAKFMTLADVQPAGTPAEIAEAVMYTFLISPSFLMRTELDAPAATTSGNQAGFQLSSYEVASRLSFMIWNSIPDSILDQAADAGELQTSEQILAQAQRMLGAEFKDKVAPVIGAAHRFYANIIETSSTSRWGKTDHDATRFSDYTPEQKAPLAAETDRFFQEVGFSGKFEDLFLSNVAYVNQDTAPLYGLNAADYGAELEPVMLDAMERPGFLTRGAFLSSFAHERDTSPILRGAFIITLMGGQTGVPDPEATKRPIPPGEYETNAEAITALTSVDASCIGCHTNNINPPGFVLENFSAIGSIQTTDPEYGGAIVTAVPSVNFPDGAKAVANAYELMQGIAAGRMTKEIYARKYVSYATGRESNDYDECTATAIANKIEAGSYTLGSVLADVTQAESFRLRVAGE